MFAIIKEICAIFEVMIMSYLARITQQKVLTKMKTKYYVLSINSHSNYLVMVNYIQQCTLKFFFSGWTVLHAEVHMSPCTFHCKIFTIIIFHCIHLISRRNLTSADNCRENIASDDSHKRDILPLSDNSKNHFEPSSLCGPEATFFIALVTDFAPENKQKILIPIKG